MQSTLAIAEPYTACTAIQNDVSGKFVLVGRGTCTFVAKAVAAQEAGAVGVIIVNNDTENPNDVIKMTDAGTFMMVSVPVLMVSYTSGAQIQNLGSDISVETTGRRGNPEFLRFRLTDLGSGIRIVISSRFARQRRRPLNVRFCLR